MQQPPPAVQISGYQPGAIGRIVELHARYYHTHWGLGPSFEAEVAAELGEFLARLDPAHDLLLLATLDGQIVGSIVIDGREREAAGARVRWFILEPELQGQGIGSLLIAEALAFCQRAGMRRLYLWTMTGLTAAHRLH